MPPAGVIDATGGDVAVNGLGAALTNAGTVEATGAALLTLDNMTLANAGAGAVIVSGQMKLETATVTGGSMTISAAGKLIAAAGATRVDPGSGTIQNLGQIIVSAGGLTLEGIVAGPGQMRLSGAGGLTLIGSTNEQATFVPGATGALAFQSGFTGRVVGLSTTGANHLDLLGVSATSYRFMGTASGGNLRLYNGATQVGLIKLAGNFLTSTFVLAPDGSGGTLISDPARLAPPLVQAAASFGPPPYAAHAIAPAGEREPLGLLAASLA